MANYTSNIPTDGTFTKIDYPIKKNAASNDSFVTYIDLIQFGQTSNFGYNHNGSNPISLTSFNNWPDALEAINQFLTNINARLEALENSSSDEPVEYTVTCNVSHGSKSPNTTQTIESGGSVSWTITPNSGYQMPTSVTGATINGNKVTVSNVTSNKTINVNCEAIPTQTYTVTCNVSYGSKSPNSTQTVDSGGSVSWTITPNSGYQMPTFVTGATINGNKVTVNNVTSNKTINVTCIQSQPQTTYYWYVGVDNPNGMDPENYNTHNGLNEWTNLGSSLPTADIKVGKSDTNYEDHTWYIAAPTDANFTLYNANNVASNEAGYNKTTFNVGSVSYTLWTSKSEGWQAVGYLHK